LKIHTATLGTAPFPAVQGSFSDRMRNKSHALTMFLLFSLVTMVIPQKAALAADASLPPDEFGNTIINRISEKNRVKPVAFSHWLHRKKYTCRVCHFELEFNMQHNTTEVTEKANQAGKFCGACHNGRTAFGHEKPHCEKCHNGNRGYGKERFPELSGLPVSGFGNKKDWVKALENGLIQPIRFLTVPPPKNIAFEKQLQFEQGGGKGPAAVFPHKSHIAWLDCNNCHPDIFTMKKGAQHFTMDLNAKGQFCGVCHLTVAFPLQDCGGCHPSMRN